jgi:hypothetical protein
MKSLSSNEGIYPAAHLRGGGIQIEKLVRVLPVNKLYLDQTPALPPWPGSMTIAPFSPAIILSFHT